MSGEWMAAHLTGLFILVIALGLDAAAAHFFGLPFTSLVAGSALAVACRASAGMAK
jgi:hypothetical protein